jgi:hypothetical protein
MTDDMRPDRAHLYIAGMNQQSANIMVDSRYPDAWQTGIGKDVVEYVRKSGRHVIVAVGDQITFLAGYGISKPEKLLLDWIL